MKILFAGLFTILFLQCGAQTNLAPITPEQFEAVKNAMPKYFDITQDPVSDAVTIESRESLTLESSSSAEMEVSVFAFANTTNRIPKTISFHFRSHSLEWRFLNSREVTMRIDQGPPTDLVSDYKNKVLSDASVIESFWPDVSLDQFKKIAFSKRAFFKVGYKNYEVSEDARKPWKLMSRYFEAKQKDRDVDLDKAISTKPSTNSPAPKP